MTTFVTNIDVPPRASDHRELFRQADVLGLKYWLIREFGVAGGCHEYAVQGPAKPLLEFLDHNLYECQAQEVRQAVEHHRRS